MNTPDSTPTVGAIPWYQSPTTIGLIVTLISGIGAAIPEAGKVLKDLGFGTPAEIANSLTGIGVTISTLASVYALYKRITAKAQPVTLTQAAADAHPATVAAKGM